MVQTTSGKQISRTFKKQITVFKAQDLFNESVFFNPL